MGFFWQTYDSGELLFDQGLSEQDLDYDTQNTMSLVYKKVYREAPAMMGILNRVLQEGFDLAGVRLVYPTAELMKVATGGASGSIKKPQDGVQISQRTMLNNIGPIVAMAVRGTFARSLWLDAVGPSDPALARRTDPTSLCALYGGESRDECLLFCPRNPTRILSELARWFGGRVPASGVIDIGSSKPKQIEIQRSSSGGRSERPSSAGSRRSKKAAVSEMDGEVVSHKPVATLTATDRSEIFIVLSPLIPTKCVGLILSTAQKRGFHLRGIRRTRLSAKRAAALGNSIFIQIV